MPWRPLFHPSFPFKPSKLPFFYGWVIVFVSILGSLASIPGQTMGVSVFTDDLVTALGLGRTTLSHAYLVGTVLSGLLLPLGGRAIDTLGSRIIAVCAAIQLGLTLIYLSQFDRIADTMANSLSGTALGRVVPRNALAWLLIALGFVSLRFSGQGMLTLVSRNLIGKWFNRYRGLMAGLSGLFVSFGFATSPLFYTTLIKALSWRGAWLVLAALLIGGFSLIAWLLFRDNPEECGLQMDGLGDNNTAAKTTPADTKPARFPLYHEFHRHEATKTLAFWSLTLALSLQALILTGVIFHFVNIGTSAGLTQESTVRLFIPIAVVSTSVGLLIGFFSDRMAVERLLYLMILAMSVACVAIAYIGVPSMAIVVALALGTCNGFMSQMGTIALPRYFGRRHLGAISGLQMMFMVLGSALGPSLLAMSNTHWGGYTTGLLLLACLPAGLVLLVVFTRNPQLRYTPSL